MLQPILSVDLGTRKTEQVIIPGDWQQKFVGGATLAARLLYPYLSKELEPLSPEAPLLFITGPLTGTSGPTTGRFVICGKSPATGLWAESHIGGFWGPERRKAGFDGLWLTGRSETPVYLWIQDGKVEIRDASHLMGRDCYETLDLVKAEVEDRDFRR